MIHRFILFLVVIFLANSSFAQNIYVSKSEGTEEGDGSAGNPCLTITQAVSLATDGSVIYINDGVFRETVRITKSNITITADNENVYVTGNILSYPNC